MELTLQMPQNYVEVSNDEILCSEGGFKTTNLGKVTVPTYYGNHYMGSREMTDYFVEFSASDIGWLSAAFGGVLFKGALSVASILGGTIVGINDNWEENKYSFHVYVG
jgi:hypothetical protein